jgi:hypothetical protein
VPRDASFAGAVARVQRAWGERPLARTTLRTHVGQLRAFDLPGVLEMFHPSRRDTCFLALLQLGESEAVVGAGTAPDLTVPVAQIESLWTRDAVLFWAEGDEPSRARETLSSLGFTEPDLKAALTRFQQRANLVPDGLLGPRTRMALFALAPGERPRLSAEGGGS